jgi:hypothetical protein
MLVHKNYDIWLGAKLGNGGNMGDQMGPLFAVSGALVKPSYRPASAKQPSGQPFGNQTSVMVLLIAIFVLLIPSPSHADQESIDTFLLDSRNARANTIERAVRQIAENREVLADNSVRERLIELVASHKGAPTLRQVAAYALGNAGSASPDIVSALIRTLKGDGSPDVQAAAARSLDRIGAKAPAVLDSLNDKEQETKTDTNVRAACIEALFHLDPNKQNSIRRLILILESTESIEMKRFAVYTLAQAGPDAIVALPSITAAVKSPDPKLQEVATWAIGLIGPQAIRSVKVVAGVLTLDHDVKVRKVAAEALEHIGSDDPFVIDRLTKSFEAESSVEVKIAMATALADLGRGPDTAKAFFGALHSSQDRALQQAAATGLSRVIPPANADVQALVSVSSEEYPDVRSAALKAIGHIHQQPDVSLPALVRGLSDRIFNVRLVAVQAIGEFRDLGHCGRSVIKSLSNELDNEMLRFEAARSLQNIADSLRSQRKDVRYFELVEPLNKAAGKLRPLADSEPNNYQFTDSYNSVEAAMGGLARGRFWHILSDWASRHNYIAKLLVAAGVYLLWIGVLYLLILRLWPLTLVRWYEVLARFGSVKVPVLGSIVVPVKGALLLNASEHSRVLAAWVEHHADGARTNFINRYKGTGDFYFPLPVAFDNNIPAELSPGVLSASCDRNKFLLRILGEGGVGKTTLACQIALWSLAKEPSKRLFADRRMIPVILEGAAGFDSLNDTAYFKSAIKGRLQDLISEAEPVPDWLCERLLQDKRLLVIIDGLSEMENRNCAPLPLRSDYAVAALIITSRNELLWSDVSHVDVRPLKISRDHLSPFITACLGKTVRLPDTDLYEACGRLAALVGNRSITPLLARMYAEQLAASYASRHKLPENIPDLVLGYVATLNRARKTDDPDHSTVHRAAELAAWECCRETLSVGYAKRDRIATAFASVNLNITLLDYLETRLRLVRTVPPLNVYIEFLLDPLAEYLAAMWLINLCKDRHDWVKFLNKVDRLAPRLESMADFLEAVLDCYAHTSSDSKAVESVARELSNRIQRGKLSATVGEKAGAGVNAAAS